MSNVRFLTSLQPQTKLTNADRTKHKGRNQAQRSMISLPNEIYSAILGALLGAWLTYYFARRLSADQLKNMLALAKAEAVRAAGIRLRHAFAKELSALKSGLSLSVDLQHYLRAAYDARHAEAATNFEPFVPKARLAGFRGDWQRYCYGEHENGAPLTVEEIEMDAEELLFLTYNAVGNHLHPGLPRKLAITRIVKLLSYAEET